MSAHEASESVEQARQKLAALRARCGQAGVVPGPQELESILRGVQELLEQLSALHSLTHDILDRTNDAAYAKGRDGLYELINLRGAELLGKTRAAVLGADDRVLYEPADAERIMVIDREVMSTAVPQTREETVSLRGVPKTLLTSTSAWHDAEHKVLGVIGIAQDVTERRRSEREAATQHERMHCLAAETAIGEDRSRRSLAADLQNRLGQDLALAKMRLAMLRSSTGRELHEPLSRIEHIVERAERSLRSIIYQISPPSLHDLGLVAALCWLGGDISKQCGIDVRIEDDGSPGIADERIRGILFRAVRELLMNIAAHARVHEASVHLERQDDQVRITVSDSGSGFDMANIDQRGYGLFRIREQLTYVGGSMHVEAALDRGTTVTLVVPASKAAARPT